MPDALAALLEQRDTAAQELENLRHDPETGAELETLSDEQEARCAELLTEIEERDKSIEIESARVRQVKMLAEARRLSLPDAGHVTDAAVTSEPMVYGCNEKYQARNSWWFDEITLSRGPQHPDYGNALARRQQYGHQVEVEVANDTAIGRDAIKQLREQNREFGHIFVQNLENEIRDRGRNDGAVEARAVGTGGGPTVTSIASSASSFVTPVFVGPYVPYRQYGRAFADQCEKPEMPDYGMGIFKPVITAAAGVGAFTEDPSGSSPVTEVDPYAGYLSGALGIYAGEVTLSQAVLDRTAPDFRYDVAVEDQIQRAEAPELNAYVLGKALANANVIAFNGSFSLAVTSGTGGFTGAVGQAKKTMRKTEGAVLNPTHLWLDPAPWEYIENWSDANGRPVVVPNYAGPFNAIAAGSADGDAGIEGATGYKLNALQAFTDANLPTTGGTANLYQALVCCMTEIEYYEGKPYNRILPQTNATYLQTIVQRYRYVTVIVNYNAAVQAIQGTAWGTITW